MFSPVKQEHITEYELEIETEYGQARYQFTVKEGKGKRSSTIPPCQQYRRLSRPK